MMFCAGFLFDSGYLDCSFLFLACSLLLELVCAFLLLLLNRFYYIDFACFHLKFLAAHAEPAPSVLLFEVLGMVSFGMLGTEVDKWTSVLLSDTLILF